MFFRHFLVTMFAFGAATAMAQPVSTAFTYQGELRNAGTPAEGLHDLNFRLYDALDGGAQIGTTFCANDVSVIDGLFTIALDFGPQFAGEQRFLEIEVREDTGLDCDDATGFTALVPRQALTAAPYALFALNADLLDGLDSTAFLQSVPVPLTLSGTSATHIIRGANASTNGGSMGVLGVSSAASGITFGVYGRCESTDGSGVYGFAPAASGTNSGVLGESYSTDGRGISGLAYASSGLTHGVHGQSASTDGRGVYGLATAVSGTTYGGYFEATGSGGTGVFGSGYEGVVGFATNPNGNGVVGTADGPPGWGVLGQSFEGLGVYGASDSGTGVYGVHDASGTAPGVHGVTYSTSPSAVAVLGEVFSTSPGGFSAAVRGVNNGTGGAGIGVWGSQDGAGWGIYGTTVSGFGVYGSATGASGETYGVWGQSESTSGYGVIGINDRTGNTITYGVYGRSATAFARGVYGLATAASGNPVGVLGESNGIGFGVYSLGDMGASGVKPFRIDHPDDPENKYLLHYAAESSEVINFYRGTVVLDGAGEAVVELPHYFAKINKTPSYQLTALGAPMPMLHVAEEIDEGALSAGATSEPGEAAPVCSFRIAGGKPGAKVSWRVEAVRNDRWVQQRGAPVEVEKQDLERGTYQHPELYGQPPEKGMNYDATRAGPAPAHPEPGHDTEHTPAMTQT